MSDELNTGAPPSPAPQGDAGAPAVPENTAPPAAGTDPAKTADPAAQPPKPKREGGFQRRINELTHRLRESERREERLLAAVGQKSGAPQEEKPPKPDQYNTLDEYIEAKIAYANRKGAKQPNDGDSDNRGGDRPRGEVDPAIVTAIDDLRADGSEKYEDFEDLMDEAKYITPPMARAILELEEQVDVAYHLFTNQKEARRISRLSPMRQIAEIGKVAARIAAAPPTPRPSSAPAPVSPVGGGNTQSLEPSEKDDTKTWIEKRRQKVHGSRK